MFGKSGSQRWVLCAVAALCVAAAPGASEALFLKSTLKKIKKTAEKAGGAIKKGVTGAANTVKKAVTGTANRVAERTKNVIERTKTSLTRAADKFVKRADDFFAGVKSKLLAAQDKSVKALVGAYESAKKGVLVTLRDWSVEAGNTVFAGMADVVRKIGHALRVCPSGQEIEPATIFDPGKFKCVPKCTGAVKLDPKDGVTFFVASDIHVGKDDSSYDNVVRMEDSERHVRSMNAITSEKWPAGTASAGRVIGKPAGLIITGDMTSHGHLGNLERLKDLYETGRTSRGVTFPVYPGLGNHDHGDVDGVPDFNSKRMRRWIQKRVGGGCGGVANVHSTTKHYSWDWAGIHFVQLNTYFNEHEYGQAGGPKWLEDDLHKSVGSSGRPIVLFQHYGYDTFSKELDDKGKARWWSEVERAELARILRGYNVAAIFTGHVHSPGQGKIIADHNIPSYMTGAGGEGPNKPGAEHVGHFHVVRIANGKMDVTRYRWSSTTGDKATVQFKDTVAVSMGR